MARPHPSPPPAKPEKAVLHRLAAVTRRASAVCAERYAEAFGLGVAEWRLLAELDRLGTLSAKQVGAHIGMDKVAVSRAAAKCLARGVVRETPSSRDGRSKDLSLTPEGAALYRDGLPRAAAHVGVVEAALRDKDVRRLKKLLKKLDRYLSGLASGAGGPPV